MKTEIIYEDKDILVIYKPAGLATQTSKVGQQDVVSELKNYLRSCGQQSPYLGVIHRLDQPVEGLLVFAKTRAAAGNLTGQLQKQGEGGLHKQYYAVVCGQPAGQQGELVDYLYKSQDNKAVIVEAPGSRDNCNARKAVLNFRVLNAQKPLALVDIQILTGRFHQIRAQMAHANLPLLGDTKYGNPESMDCARQLEVRNVALCAYSLEFLHPTTGKKLEFKVEPKGKAFSLTSK